MSSELKMQIKSRHDDKPRSKGRYNMLCLVLLALCASAVVLPAEATEATINAKVYITDATGIDLTDVATIKAGQTFVLNFLLADQATNATVGSVMGFGVVLRSKGPSQVQYTVQLASGSLQVSIMAAEQLTTETYWCTFKC